MTHMHKTPISILIILINSAFSVNSQQHSNYDDPRIVIMQETGDFQNELPVMEILPDTLSLYISVHQNIKNSFLDRFLDLYQLCQYYLIGEGELKEIEPFYLALTDNQGGFAKEGFYLNTGETTFSKERDPYVDIMAESAIRDMEGLMSITQLLPHEMAHVMYRLLSHEDSLLNNNRSVDMHYFSVITDYPTAFNEGFAEHMENVARHYEKNDSIRAGIKNDLEHISEYTKHSIKGFKRDFIFPFRMGFYKAGMINWFQKFEDYKRSEYALTGKIRYKNKSLKLPDPENSLTYRNSGVEQEEEVRNIVQFHSTEGAISAFFTALSLRDLQDINVSNSLFNGLSEWDEFEWDPLSIQFLKYFHVIHNYVIRNHSNSSQFSDFIQGYIESFPEEKRAVLDIYKELSGADFTPDLPPSLWIMVSDYQHRLLSLDPFGAIEVPLYTFNLNAAEVEDLLTIKDLSEEEAEAIIQYRDHNGSMEHLEDLLKIPGLSKQTSRKIINLEFDQSEFEGILDGFTPELTLSKLIITPLLHVLSKALLYFGIIFIFIIYLLRKRGQLEFRKILRLSMRYLFLWLGIVILETVILFLFPHSWYYTFLPVAVAALISLLIYKNKQEKLSFSFYIISLILVISLISVV